LKPPSFSVSEQATDSLVLHYYSERPGLAPLVVGLLKGLGDRFGLEVEATWERVDSGRPHDRFRVRWHPKGVAA
jgi:hypothetical protein